MSKVFVSYAHEDLDWAEQIAAGLAAEHFELFFDKQSLRVGENWEAQILKHLGSCDHFVVVWSKAALASAWVIRERERFDLMRYKGDKRIPGRMLVHVLLDDTKYAYESDQALTDLQDAKRYTAGAAAVPAPLWGKVARRMAEVLNDLSVPVYRAVITLAKAKGGANAVPSPYNYDSLEFDFVPPGGRSLTQLLGEMQILPAQLESYYGASRMDWRPFGGAQSVEQILDDVRRDLNRAGGVPIRWVSVDEDLFSNNAESIQRAAAKLAAGLSVVVLDPVALYSKGMPFLLQYLSGCLINPHAIVMVLPLFPMPPLPKTHQDMVRQAYLQLVNYFYEEPPGNVPVEHAQCSVFTVDDADMRRLVRSTLLRYSREKQAERVNAYLGGVR